MPESIESLLEFVKSLNKPNLKPLIDELINNPSPMAVYLNRERDDWERFSSLLTGDFMSGSDIYRFLYPTKQGILD